MGDSATIALNLTFFGTVGVAAVMFVGLFLIFTTILVIAGIGRLVAVTVMALFGRLPKNETVPVVHLPAQPQEAPAAATDGAAHTDGVAPPDSLEYDDGAAALLPDTAPSGAATPATEPAREPRAPRDWNKVLRPATLKPRLRAAVERHPLVTAVRREPLVLAEGWAAAVAEADARAIARARAAAPEITVSLRDLPSPDARAQDVLEVAPLVESALHQDTPVQSIPRSFRKPTEPGPLAMLDTGSLASLSGHVPATKGKLPAARR